MKSVACECELRDYGDLRETVHVRCFDPRRSLMRSIISEQERKMLIVGVGAVRSDSHPLRNSECLQINLNQGKAQRSIFSLRIIIYRHKYLQAYPQRLTIEGIEHKIGRLQKFAVLA